ncbi:hypothetical protein BDK51DRAFT_37408 [Blyttiomyces helicus]|uniref:Uncharacterized protein n=1 Tax=Blyttiomyces helicus TaxID=388810 RepID=A0A4V1IPM7_9FUNG|nr:hypothetical protein BDK51DRAFT_37408 [Blyttiomyces helicus]|eukprot:RKO83597.1 hypothetical protein BDK51DRAFT_37408 [Blyttiomyces helicus]
MRQTSSPTPAVVRPTAASPYKPPPTSTRKRKGANGVPARPLLPLLLQEILHRVVKALPDSTHVPNGNFSVPRSAARLCRVWDRAASARILTNVVLRSRQALLSFMECCRTSKRDLAKSVRILELQEEVAKSTGTSRDLQSLALLLSCPHLVTLDIPVPKDAGGGVVVDAAVASAVGRLMCLRIGQCQCLCYGGYDHSVGEPIVELDIEGDDGAPPALEAGGLPNLEIRPPLRRLTGDCRPNMLRACPSIAHLDLNHGGCTDATLALLQDHPLLTVLLLGTAMRFHSLTSPALQALLRCRGSYLKVLKISGSCILDDALIDCIAESAPGSRGAPPFCRNPPPRYERQWPPSFQRVIICRFKCEIALPSKKGKPGVSDREMMVWSVEGQRRFPLFPLALSFGSGAAAGESPLPRLAAPVVPPAYPARRHPKPPPHLHSPASLPLRLPPKNVHEVQPARRCPVWPMGRQPTITALHIRIRALLIPPPASRNHSENRHIPKEIAPLGGWFGLVEGVAMRWAGIDQLAGARRPPCA